MRFSRTLAAVTALGLAAGAAFAEDITLLNVSYDPTRELHQEYNAAFAKHWKAKTGDSVTVKQSQGGSGKLGKAPAAQQLALLFLVRARATPRASKTGVT